MAQSRKGHARHMQPARDSIVMPTFTIAPFIGRSHLDDLETDLVLMTKLYRMDVPEDLHVKDPETVALLKRHLRDFQGKRGASRLIEVPLKNSRGESSRRILLAGLGSAQSYSGSVVCHTFQLLVEHALEQGDQVVTVPFVPNPMTKEALSHKATAFKLKDVTRRVLSAHEGPVNLREIQLYCTPNAVRHLQEALDATEGPGCCRCAR